MAPRNLCGRFRCRRRPAHHLSVFMQPAATSLFFLSVERNLEIIDRGHHSTTQRSMTIDHGDKGGAPWALLGRPALGFPIRNPGPAEDHTPSLNCGSLIWHLGRRRWLQRHSAPAVFFGHTAVRSKSRYLIFLGRQCWDPCFFPSTYLSFSAAASGFLPLYQG